MTRMDQSRDLFGALEAIPAPKTGPDTRHRAAQVLYRHGHLDIAECLGLLEEYQRVANQATPTR